MANKKTNKNSKNYKKEYEQNKSQKRQFFAILVFAIGVLSLFILIIPGENIWHNIHNFLYGIFSAPALLIPIAFIYISVMSTIDKPFGDIKHKVWQTGVIVISFSALLEILSGNPYVGDGFFETIGQLYQDGILLSGGGVVSSIIGWPLLLLFGKIGSIIITSLIMFIFTMIVTKTTLISLFRSVAKPVKKIEQSYKEQKIIREQRKTQNIDVDLGPETLIEEELPKHPASSPKPTIEELIELEKQDNIILLNSEENTTPKEYLEKLINISNQDYEIKTDILLEIETVVDGDEQPKIYSDNNNQFNTYIAPPISILKQSINKASKDISDELKNNADLLVDTLKNFNVSTKVTDIARGPAVTRYELQPAPGVKISKITGLADDIALGLASAGVRIEAPIPNKAAVGIEIPNKITDIVTMREIIESKEFKNSQSRLSVALGKDITGNCVIADIAKMPHMLIAGATGSGKSVCINSIIISILYKSSPSEVRLLMVDPKVVELGVYNGIPHLLVPVVTDPRKAAGALNWAVNEMLNRYKLFAENNVRDLSGYNNLAKKTDEMDPMPQIVIIIDELADLMMAAPNEVEDAICRLAQMARAAGMHLIIATQRPSVDVITGVIKANIPSRIAFAVSSQVDSRTILDSGGAEKLLGRGDMLFYPVGISKPLRVQGCFVTDTEVEQVVSFVKNKESAEYDDKIIEEIDKQTEITMSSKKQKNSDSGGGFTDKDELFNDAIEYVIEAGQASTSYLQRKLKVGYARAARIIDNMEEQGIVTPSDGSKARQVLITRQQWVEMNMNSED